MGDSGNRPPKTGRRRPRGRPYTVSGRTLSSTSVRPDTTLLRSGATGGHNRYFPASYADEPRAKALWPGRHPEPEELLGVQDQSRVEAQVGSGQDVDGVGREAGERHRRHLL